MTLFPLRGSLFTAMNGMDKAAARAGTAHRRVLRSIMSQASGRGRDAAVRALARSRQWFSLLPMAIRPEAGDAEVVVVSPREYLDMATGGAAGRTKGCLVVDGDINLSGDGGELFLDGGKIGTITGKKRGVEACRCLPRAVVRGDLVISDLRTLRSVDLDVTGNAKISGADGLLEIRGEIFGNLSLRCSGTAQIGADLRVGGDLALFHLAELRTINCDVAGDLLVIDSGVEETGPALRVGGTTRFDGCPGLRRIGGAVAGRVVTGTGEGLHDGRLDRPEAGRAAMARGREGSGRAGRGTPSMEP